MTNALEGMWKWTWPNLRYCSYIYLDLQRRNTENSEYNFCVNLCKAICQALCFLTGYKYRHSDVTWARGWVGEGEGEGVLELH